MISAAVEPAAGDSQYSAYKVSLVSSEGYEVRGYLRVPRQPGVWPAVILLGGVRTGKMAAELISPDEPYIILGLDYPYSGPIKLTAVQFLTRVLAIRRAMLLTPSAVMLGIDYLRSRPDVRASRITLAGASFGAQLVTVAGALDPRAGPIVVCYGGGDFALLIDANLKDKPAWLRGGLARAGAWLLRPVEPLTYVQDIAPDPVILINGLQDDRIPFESVMLLYQAAREPKRLIWLREGHISSRDEALLGRVLSAATQALADLKEEGVVGE